MISTDCCTYVLHPPDLCVCACVASFPDANSMYRHESAKKMRWLDRMWSLAAKLRGTRVSSESLSARDWVPLRRAADSGVSSDDESTSSALPCIGGLAV